MLCMLQYRNCDRLTRIAAPLFFFHTPRAPAEQFRSKHFRTLGNREARKPGGANAINNASKCAVRSLAHTHTDTQHTHTDTYQSVGRGGGKRAIPQSAFGFGAAAAAAAEAQENFSGGPGERNRISSSASASAFALGDKNMYEVEPPLEMGSDTNYAPSVTRFVQSNCHQSVIYFNQLFMFVRCFF